MLKCKDIVDNSSDYLDRSMPFGKRISVWLHIMMCVNCRRYLRYIQAVMALLPTIKPQEDDEVLVDKIMMKIDVDKNKQS